MRFRIRFAATLLALSLGFWTPTTWAVPFPMGRSDVQLEKQADTSIEIYIKALYDMDHRIDLEDIQVKSHKGVVTLTGTVFTDYERSTAEHLASTIRDVEGLINEIRVVGPLNSDIALTKTVHENILQNPAFKILQFKADVRDGTVQLFGFANSPKQKERLEKIVRGIPGVQDLHNNIVIQQ